VALITDNTSRFVALITDAKARCVALITDTKARFVALITIIERSLALTSNESPCSCFTTQEILFSLSIPEVIPSSLTAQQSILS
jgi:hypothetical protein